MSDRRDLARRLAPLVLLALLAAGWLVPEPAGVRLASADPEPAQGWTDALEALPADALVLVGFDPDVGTYAEIRPTVRAALADLLNRDARLAFVNLTPEGRALLTAELVRLGRGEANPTRWLDLGFLPGAEAALVSLAAGPDVPAAADGAIARRLADGGAAVIDALVVVGGNDLGPRSWVEQVLPRIGERPLLAIAPTVLLPELQPFLASGQIDALLATPRDGAAYRAAVELGPLERLREPEPSGLPLLLGMLVALAVLGQAWLARTGSSIRELGREGREHA